MSMFDPTTFPPGFGQSSSTGINQPIAPGTGTAASTYEYWNASNFGGWIKDKPKIGSVEWLEQQAANNEEWAIDYLTNYRLSQDSVNDARAWTAQREDTQYQRMVEDLRRAGINPYFALTGGSPVSSSSQGVNYQGSYNTSARNNYRTNSQSNINNIRNFNAKMIGELGDLLNTLLRGAFGAYQSQLNATASIIKGM